MACLGISLRGLAAVSLLGMLLGGRPLMLPDQDSLKETFKPLLSMPLHRVVEVVCVPVTVLLYIPFFLNGIAKSWTIRLLLVVLIAGGYGLSTYTETDPLLIFSFKKFPREGLIYLALAQTVLMVWTVFFSGSGGILAAVGVFQALTYLHSIRPPGSGGGGMEPNIFNSL